MLTIKGPIKYPAKSVPVPIAPEMMPAPDIETLRSQRDRLIYERDRLLREARRLEGILWGINRAIELLTQ